MHTQHTCIRTHACKHTHARTHACTHTHRLRASKNRNEKGQLQESLRNLFFQIPLPSFEFLWSTVYPSPCQDIPLQHYVNASHPTTRHTTTSKHLTTPLVTPLRQYIPPHHSPHHYVKTSHHTTRHTTFTIHPTTPLATPLCQYIPPHY
jgi:hypothetical protein